MAKINLIHSKRVGKNGTAPILVMVSHKTKTAYISTEVSVEPQDFVNGMVVNRKDSRMLNNILDSFMMQTNANLLRLVSTTGIEHLDVKELRDKISPSYDPIAEEEKQRQANLFMVRFVEFKDTHDNLSTQALYQRTINAMRKFDADIDKRTFEDIDAVWLNKFKKARAERDSSNTISTYLCHIRAVFNYAINEGITTTYPYRKKKGVKSVTIDSEPSQVQPMSLEHLREIWNAPLEEWQERWVDLAKLVFLFIGINMIDMADLTEIDQNGYINYQRHKTKDRSRNGAWYHIKVEPEARAIIDKYRGEHLLNLFDGRKDYQSANKQMVHAVKCIGLPPADKGGKGKRSAASRHCKKRVTKDSKYGYFCLYALRKAWATIAFNECGIPMEVISMALGHQDGRGLSVTQRYVYADNKLIDDANRKVIDFVLYNKKE